MNFFYDLVYDSKFSILYCVIDRFAAIVHEQDLESGLHYSLRREVAGSKQIEGEKLNALKAYVLVLSKVEVQLLLTN